MEEDCRGLGSNKFELVSITPSHYRFYGILHYVSDHKLIETSNQDAGVVRKSIYFRRP